MPFSALVTGANRGIGLEVAKQLLSGDFKADHVFATCRNTNDCKDLRDLQKSHPNLHILQLEVTDEAGYARVVNQVEDVVKEHGLNLLFNNAGKAMKTPLGEVKSEMMVQLFKINAVAPIMLTQAFLPLLRRAAARVTGDAMSARRAAVVNVSSRLGSISDNGMGSFYEYRGSKVGLNGLTRSLGIDLRPEHILAITIDPGWVRTDLGGSKAKWSAAESASKMLTALTKISNKDASMYLDFHGKPIEW